MPNFASCLKACDAEDECIAVSYFETACYFKNGYQGMVPSKHVNSAFVINQANYPVPSRDEVYAGRGCGSSLPAGQLPGGPTSQFFISSAGLNRSFSVHVPSSYDTNNAAPLIFAFHGRSESPLNIEGYSGLSSEALNPYGIVVYPLGVAVCCKFMQSARTITDTSYRRTTRATLNGKVIQIPSTESLTLTIRHSYKISSST